VSAPTPPRRLRILIVPLKPWPSDHAMLETVYARLLPERGHRVEWIMRSAEQGRSGVAVWHGSLVHLTPHRRGGTVGAVVRRSLLLREFVRVARRSSFDIIQVRNGVGAGLLALVLRRTTGARSVFQLSFPVLEWSAGRARARGSVTGRLIAASTRLAILVRRWMLRRVDLVLAISERMREDLVRSGVPSDRVLVVPLGAVDGPEPDASAVRELRGRLGFGDAPVVLYFGSISPERELGFLIRVAARVGRSHPEVRWVLLGPAAHGEDGRLRGEADRLGIGDRVRLPGPVPRAEVATYLGLCALTVSPIPPNDLYAASSPSKTVESLAAGRPVVATPIPDQAALIERSRGGTVVAFDVDAFAAAVEALLEDPDRCRRAGESGRAFVREHRSYERLATQIEQAYREVLGSPP
jgi:glycosyltransferase involved in cell wall biosynthesis